jgi:hypothetical protein
VTHLGDHGPTPVRNPARVHLAGGDTVVFSVRPGRYSLRIVTPISDQPPGYAEGKPHVWQSEPLNVVAAPKRAARVVVVPTAIGGTYDGGWRIRALGPGEEPAEDE